MATLKDFYEKSRRSLGLVGPAEHDRQIAVEAALHAIMGQTPLEYPVECAALLRCLTDPIERAVEVVKPEEQAGAFTRAMARLQQGEAAVPMSVAAKVALAADRFHADFTPHGDSDVATHFKLSSSLRAKGRLLFNLARYFRPAHVLEFGTAYGISALFLCEAQRACGRLPQITTLEGFEPQMSLSSALLRAEYGAGATCLHGLKSQHLDALASGPPRFDFFFHDGGHRGDDYVDEFKALAPVLNPGAIVVFDDIRWDDTPGVKPSQPSTRTCFEGWKAVIDDQRVTAAAEIDRNVGVLQMAA